MASSDTPGLPCNFPVAASLRILCVLCFLPLATFAQSAPAASKKPPLKPVITADELITLDSQYQKEFDAAKNSSDWELFPDAARQFTALADEIEETLKRLTKSTIQKGGTLDIEGVMKPASLQTAIDFFYGTLVKARRGAEGAQVLEGVAAMQKQARDLLNQGKFTEARDSYKKSADVLTENRAKLERSSFQYFSTRADNGQRETNAAYWSSTLAQLRAKYQTTEKPGTSPAEIRAVIKSVADEIVREDYITAAKHPEMQDETRASFRALLDTATEFLKTH